jgi:hypothetical protein
MNPRRIYGAFVCEREPRLEDLCLTELEDRVLKITKKQNYISNCGLSDEVTSLAIKELEVQKTELRQAMHKIVDRL